MKQYILSDGRTSKWISPENEQAFFEQLKKQGLTATPKSEEVGKSKGTNQSQNNQQKNIKQVNQNLGVNLDTGEVIKNTESNLEDGSSELSSQDEEILKYDTLLKKHKKEDQSQSDFLNSIKKGERKLGSYKLGMAGTLFLNPTTGTLNQHATTYGDMSLQDYKALGKENEYHELEFLYNQIQKGTELRDAAVGDYEHLSDIEVVQKFDEVPRPTNDETEKKSSQISNADYLELNNSTDLTRYQQEEYQNNIDQFAAEKYGSLNSQYSKDYNKTVAPILSEIEDEVHKKFDGQKKQIEGTLEPKIEEIQNEYYSKIINGHQFDATMLQENAKRNFARNFPNGGTQEDIDNANKELNQQLKELENKYNLKLEEAKVEVNKEVEELYGVAFQDLNEEMNEDFNNRINLNPDVVDLKNRYTTQMKNFEKDIINEYSKDFVTYDKWDSTFGLDEGQSLKSIGNRLDKQGFAKLVNTEDKRIWLNHELQSLINSNPNLEPEDKRELALEFFNYFSDKLNFDEDKTYSTYFMNNMASEVKDVVKKLDTLKVEKWKDGKGIEWNRVVGEKNDEYKKILKDIKTGKEYDDLVKKADLNSDGLTTQAEIDVVVENRAATRYYREHGKQYELASQLAQDIMDAPESVDDIRINQFIDGWNYGDNQLAIPVYGSIKSMHNNHAIELASNKEAEGGVLNEGEKLLLAMNNMDQTMRSKVKDLKMDWFNTAGIIKHAVPWMGEFVLTSPAFKVAQSAVGTALKSNFLKANFLNALKGKKFILPKADWALKSGSGMKLGASALKENAAYATSVLAGSVLQTFANPQRIASELSQRMTGDHMFALSDLADDTISAIDAYTYSSEEGKKLGLKGPTESFNEAFVRSFGKTWSELFTERLGAYFPSWGKKALNGMKRGIGPMGKVINDVDYWKRVTLGRFTRKLGLTPGSKAFNNLMKQIGWHGALSEVGEELINFPLSNLIDGSTPVWAGIRKYDKFGNDIGWDTQSLKELGLSVGVMSGGFYGTGVVASKALGYEQTSYGVNGRWFNTEKEATERLEQLKKEGRLTPETEIEIKNDWVAHSKALKLLQEVFFEQGGLTEIREYKNKDGSVSNKQTSFDQTGTLVGYKAFKDIELEDGTIIKKGTTLTNEHKKKKWRSSTGKKEVKLSDAQKNLELFINQTQKKALDQIKTNDPKNKLKLVASETEVLARLSTEEGLKLDEIDNKIENLKDKLKRENNPAKQNEIRKEINKLDVQRRSILDPISKEIVNEKTKKLYKDTLKKIKKIAESNAKIRRRLDIFAYEDDGITPLTGVRAKEKALEVMGIEKINGKWVWSKNIIRSGEAYKMGEKLTPEQIEEMASDEALGNMETQHGFIIPGKYTTDGKSKIIINENLAIKKGGGNVAAHEFFHFYLDHILGENPDLKLALGRVFMNHLQNIDPKRVRDSEFRNRLMAYKNESAAVQAEESMALFIDALANGSMEYEESVMVKIGTIIRRIFQKLGVTIELGDGKSVYNWLKDFNDNIQRGELSNSFLEKIEVTGLLRDVEANIKLAKEKKTQRTEKEKEQVTKDIKKLKLPEELENEFIKFAKNQIDAQYQENISAAKFSLGEQNIIDKIIKKVKRPKQEITQDNKDIYQTIMEVAETQNITPKEAAKPYLNELIENNMGLVVAEAVEKANIGKRLTLEESKKVGFLDFFSAYSEELTSIANTWNPLEETEKTKRNPFGTYAGSLLKLRQGQVLKSIQDKLQQKGISTTGLYQQTSEGLQERQIAAEKEYGTEAFEEVDILGEGRAKRIAKKEGVKNMPAIEIEGELVEETLKFSNETKNETQQVGVDVKYDIKNKSIKDVKNDIVSQAEKVNVRTKVKPTGILYDIISSVAKNEYSINPKTILAAPQNLSKEESIGSRTKIAEDAKRLGPMKFLESVLGKFNFDAKGNAIGLNKSVLKAYYIKGKRSDSGLNLTGQVLNPKLTNKEILNPIGINEDYSLMPYNRKYDGLVKGIITQASVLQAVQVAKLEAIQNIKDSYGKDTASAIEDIQDDLNKISSGKPSILFSKVSPEAQDAISLGIGDFLLDTSVDLSNTRAVNQAFKKFMEKEFPDQQNLITPKEYSSVAKTISSAVKGYSKIQNIYKIGSRQIKMPLSKKDYVLLNVSEDAFLEKKVDKMFNIKSGPAFNDIKTINKARQQLSSMIVKLREDNMSDAEIMSMIINNLEGMYVSASKIGSGKFIPIMDPKGNYTGKIKLNPKWEGGTIRGQVFFDIGDLLASVKDVIDIADGTRVGVIEKYEINTKKFSENSKQGMKDKNWQGRFDQAESNRRAIEKVMDFYISQHKDNNIDDLDLGVLARMFGSNMRSPMKRAANLEFIAIGADKVKNPGKDLEYEHMVPTQTKILEMLKEYLENGKLRKDFWNDYTVAIIPKQMNDILNTTGLQMLMPMTWESGQPSWNRYYNMFTIGNKGLVPIKSIKDGSVIGKEFVEVNNMFVSRNLTSANLQKINRIRRAQKHGIRFSKSGKTRGMSTFDFDDTLARTKSGVRYTMPNPEGIPAPKRKVIFLAGGAGSGKSNVVKQLGLEKQGFKIVNQDISLEWLAKNSGLPSNMRDFTPEQASEWGSLQWEARDIAQKKQMKFQGRGDGIIVDGTGASQISMGTQVMKFRNAGYDVQMIFVETSLDTALERNRARKERSLKDFIVERNHKAVMANKKSFKEDFGDNFAEVNTDNLKQGDVMPTNLVNKINKFTSGYIKGRLTAEEFASRGDALLQQGAEFDFSEFNQVVDGTPGPLLEKARKRAEKYGTKDMFVLTARPQQSAFAIQQFLKGQGLNIPIGNITGLANSTGNAKAEWMLEKFAEGYNDMYFVDDALQNVKAVKDVLNQLDIKSKVVQAKIKFSKSASIEFNEILDNVKNIESGKVYSDSEARKLGILKGRNPLMNFFIPPSAEDFKGLTYRFLGKGRKGDAHAKFFKERLFDPFAKGIRNWNSYKQAMSGDYKALQKKFPDIKNILKKKIKGTSFTNQDAIRAYLWNKAGYEIPGITEDIKNKLIEQVVDNPKLTAFAEGLSIISRVPEGYLKPNEFWAVEGISSDLSNIVSKLGRADFLSEWIKNKNEIFSPENLNKIEVIYGTNFRSELEKILYRMETGQNRTTGRDAQVNGFLDWINGSVGAVMFFNMRSAALQTISMVNFINASDNNIFKSAAAFANQPQFWKDFSMIFNSDMLKQRRAGLQIDVSASELTSAFKDGKSKPQAIIHYLLEKGFKPTQIADSFAIAMGGSTFYRNRLNTYLKRGMSEAKAKKQAWLDFQEIAEETQQSSRPDLISNQQAGPLGRLILAWQNTPMQMTRLMKKKTSDLVNRRRIPGMTQMQSDMANISGIIYYGVAQNILFGTLQTGLMFMLFGLGDEDEEKEKKLEQRVVNGALDTLLRGTGIYGAGIATLKNVLLKWQEERQKGWNRDNMNIAQEAINLSPPIGTKMRKIMNAVKTENYNKGVSKEIGFRIENPNLSIAANWTEALTNLPVARILTKANNLEEAITGNHDVWQRIALTAGWSRWSLGIEDEELEKAKKDAKDERKKARDIKKDVDKTIKKTIKEDQEKREKKAEEERKKKEGIKTVRCSGKNSSGKRCGLTTETNKKSWKCFHHSTFKEGQDRDGDGIKEYQCTGKTKSGKRCRNKGEYTGKKKRCYAHQ